MLLLQAKSDGSQGHSTLLMTDLQSLPLASTDVQHFLTGLLRQNPGLIMSAQPCGQTSERMHCIVWEESAGLAKRQHHRIGELQIQASLSGSVSLGIT